MIASLEELAGRDYWEDWSGVRSPTLVVRTEDGMLRDVALQIDRGATQRAGWRRSAMPGMTSTWSSPSKGETPWNHSWVRAARR